MRQSSPSVNRCPSHRTCTSSSIRASAFSFLQGASLPEALVERAAELGYPALALLDRDGVYGAPRFHKAALAAGIRPIIGAELTIAEGQDRQDGQDGKRASTDRSRPSSLVPHFQPSRCPSSAKAQEGYRNLCRLITRMKLRAPKGEGALTLDELDGCTARAGRAGRPRRARRPRGTASAACSIAWSACSAAAASTSSCSGIFGATRSATTSALVEPGGGVPRADRSRPTASASRRRRRGRCSTSSPASTTTPISRRRGGGWRPTPSAT